MLQPLYLADQKGNRNTAGYCLGKFSQVQPTYGFKAKNPYVGSGAVAKVLGHSI
jgi:hypothetical protein